MDNGNFYTLKGYERLEEKKITYAMEDYLEMICRLYQEMGLVRITDLAKNLNVRPSSVTKMVEHLKSADLVESQKYGAVKPTDMGMELGRYLIKRHNIIHELLCHINHSENELEQVEKIEHFLNEETIKNIETFLQTIAKP
ncbi:MAG: winged helix DNA-binding protein [Epulopiscium sp.]|nr:winged helix DNA-binding protein [Candidatus Epulonipiscium sp.]